MNMETKTVIKTRPTGKFPSGGLSAIYYRITS